MESFDSSPRSFATSWARHDGQSVISLVGEFDRAHVAELTQVIDEVVASSDPEIIVDLSSLPFLDSSGIAVLVAVHNTLEQQGRRLVLRQPQPNPKKALEICGLIDYLNVETA